jgi:hypothetical protein
VALTRRSIVWWSSNGVQQGQCDSNKRQRFFSGERYCCRATGICGNTAEKFGPAQQQVNQLALKSNQAHPA